MINTRGYLPAGRLLMPDRRVVLDKTLYIARQTEQQRRIAREIVGRGACWADRDVATQTIPSAPGAGFIREWWDSQASIDCFIDSNGRYYGRSTNASIAATAAGFAADTWLVDSNLKIPSGGFQTRTRFVWLISASKTGAGVAQPTYIIRVGSALALADTAYLTLTGPAQTAIADIGTLMVIVTVRVVSATVGILQGTAYWIHRGTAANTTTSGTGFANDTTGHVETTSGNVDTSPGGLSGKSVSLSLNGGAAAAWTVTQVQAEADW